MKKLIATALLAALALTGCAPPVLQLRNASSYAVEGSKFEGAATVYVFRGTSRALVVWPFQVELDGQKLGSIRRERYLAFPVPGGHHRIVVHCPALCEIRDVPFEADYVPGKTYYFFVNPYMAGGYNTMGFGLDFTQLYKSDALRLLETYLPGSPAKDVRPGRELPD